jgi:ribose transport system substrate-binding protein
MLARTQLARFAACTVLLIAAGGCAKHGGEKYYLITANKQVPYWQLARAGVDAAGRQMKIPVEFAGPDTYDPSGEQEAFRRAVSAKASGIMISPASPESLKGDIDAAIAQGVPVITLDSDAPGSKRLLFIGTNNYQAGLMGGEAAAKALGGKGSVIVYTMPNQVNLNERLQGYRAAFDRYPGIKIARVVDIQGDPRIAFDTTQKAVDDKEKIDGYVCLEALAGKEVASVLSQNHVTGKVVVAMDTDADTIDWIRKGVIAATVAQKPYTMAYFGLQVLDNLHHNPPPSLSGNWAQDTHSSLPAFIDTGATLINKDNIEAFLSAQKATEK